MKALSLTGHLLLKDLRHQRAWLLLLWGYALLIPPMARSLNGTTGVVMLLVSVSFFVLIFRLLGSVVRLDAPGRETHFLSTRPVPWAVLLASKLGFIGLLLLVPAAIAKLGCIFLLGIPVNAMDVVLALAESAITVGALLGIVMLFAMFFRSVALALVSLIAAGIIASICESHIHIPPPNTVAVTLPVRADVTLIHCQSLVFPLGFVLTVGAAAAFRYRRKRIVAPLCVLVTGIVLSVCISDNWSFDLSRYFTDKPAIAGASLSAAQVKFILQDDGTEFSHVWNDSGDNVPHFTFQHDVTVEGVELPYYVSLVGYAAVAVLKSGRTIPSVYPNPSSLSYPREEMPEQWRAQVAGFAPEKDAPQTGNKYHFEVFNYKPEDYKGEDQTGATIKGVLTLEIRKLVILKTMPFKSGGTVALRRQRYFLQDVGFSADKAAYQIVADYVNVTLRGDNIAENTQEFLTWLVFNRDKGEYLVPDTIGFSADSLGSFCNYVVRKGTLVRSHSVDEPDRKPIPADWPDKAEIAFFSSEPGRRIDVPYEIKDVDLKTLAAHPK